ncbi:radical SAM protein [Sphingobium sp. AN641]|uniref:radical SAM/SPASM domain-containing protein n=1 Tax=Sphingobium sp. AN641 TaxID=3133443 RepID=UPI0030C1F4A5
MLDLRYRSLSAVVLKVTSRCNLDCAYCYEKIGPSPDMSIETFKSITSRVLQSSKKEKVLFILHGGEPLLMKNDWLAKAAAHLDRESKMFGKVARLSMQSNILNLKPSKISVLMEAGISLSASMDGPPAIKNAQRPLSERAAEAYRRARDAGLSVSVLMTINASNWNRFPEIMDWLHDDLGVKMFKANAVTPVGMGAGLAPLPSAHLQKARVDMAQHMFANRGAIVEDHMVLDFSRYVARDRNNLPQSLCRERRCGAGTEVVGFTQNGGILPCGRFEWSDHNHRLGALDDINDTAFHARVEDFHDLVPESWKDCGSCGARSICSFGCQAFIVCNKDHFNVECEQTKMMMNWMIRNDSVIRSFMTGYEGRWAPLRTKH